jgi:putative transcriptional regulator
MGLDERRTPGFRSPALPLGLALAAVALAGILALPQTAAAFPQHPLRAMSPQPGMFLYASPELPDAHFAHSVIVLVTYSDEGAMGLIINKPTEIPATDAVPDLKDEHGKLPPLYYGGPVDTAHIFFVLKDAIPPKGSLRVTDHVYMAWSREILDAALKRDPSGKNLRIYSGYAGWGPGQLDGEIRRGDWVVSDADPDSIFSEDPRKVWPKIYNIRDKIEVRSRAPRPIPVGLGPPATRPGAGDR